jgi:hypothetical protein
MSDLRICEPFEYFGARGILFGFCKRTVQGDPVLFLNVVFPVTANVGCGNVHPANWRMRRAAFVFLICFVVVVSRRPDVLFHAQFWAEDGKFWYADAYNLGAIAPLLHPAAGYFQTLPRLAALFAQLFPMVMAPLALNLVGIVIQVLPVQFLLSSRCRELGSFAGRCLFAFLYLGLPNSHEMHVDITNAYWRLALLAMLILFSQPGRTMLWNIFDFGVLALCGLTGPLIVFIAPIAGVLYLWQKRTRWRLSLLIVCGIGAVIEVLSVWIAGGSERVVNAVGCNPELFFKFWRSRCSLPFWWETNGCRLLVRFALGPDRRQGRHDWHCHRTLRAAQGPLPWKALIFSQSVLLPGGWPILMFSPQWPGCSPAAFALVLLVAGIYRLHGLDAEQICLCRRIAMALLV